MLLVKPEHEDNARAAFGDMNIIIKTDGNRHLGAALGSPKFCGLFAMTKVKKWEGEIRKLATIAATQPQAAYAVYTNVLRHKRSFLARTMTNVAGQLEHLESTISKEFIPALLSRPQLGDIERDILALPCRHGGMGIVSPVSLAAQFDSSLHVTRTLVTLILQHMSLQGAGQQTRAAKAEARRATRLADKQHAKHTYQRASTDLQRAIDLAAEKNASNWLACRPLKHHGFVLHKSAFRDAIFIRYGWTPPHLPQSCVCGATFSVPYALSCPVGGYPSLHHKGLRDVTVEYYGEH